MEAQISKQQIINNYNMMINMELNSIKNQKLLIDMYSKIHFNIGRIVVNEARQSIEQSKEAILTFSQLKKRYE